MENMQVQQFKKGAIEMVLLSIIASGETYGYEIIKKLHDGEHGIFAGARKSSVYPNLYKLERDGYIKHRDGEIKGRSVNFYSITDSGLKLLNEQKIFWKEFTEGINSFIK